MDGTFDSAHDVIMSRGVPGGEDGGQTRIEQCLEVCLRNHATTEHDDIRGAAGSELLDHLREQRLVGPGKRGETHRIDVFLHRSLGDLSRASGEDRNR